MFGYLDHYRGEQFTLLHLLPAYQHLLHLQFIRHHHQVCSSTNCSLPPHSSCHASLIAWRTCQLPDVFKPSHTRWSATAQVHCSLDCHSELQMSVHKSVVHSDAAADECRLGIWCTVQLDLHTATQLCAPREAAEGASSGTCNTP